MIAPACVVALAAIVCTIYCARRKPADQTWREYLGIDRDYSRLPGGLRRDNTWPELDAWEEHCRTTPGLSRWSSVSPTEMQPFEEALRQVPVIDFEGDL